MPRKSPKTTRLAAPIIRPSARDFEPHLFGRSLSPAALGELLDAGARGALAEQNALFNLMEDTWPRLRANLQKIKNSVRKLPLNVQPQTPKNGKPSATAQEKADFIESALHTEAGFADTTRRPLGPAVYELMDAVARGVSVVEIDWVARADGFLVPAGFRRVPMRYLGLDPDGSLALRLPPAGASVSGFSNFPLSQFSTFPDKFLIGIFRSKSGALGETAQLRALAPALAGPYAWMGMAGAKSRAFRHSASLGQLPGHRHAGRDRRHHWRIAQLGLCRVGRVPAGHQSAARPRFDARRRRPQ